MRKSLVVLLAIALLLGLTAWGVWVLPDLVLARYFPEHTSPIQVAEGFGILRHLWPVLAVGSLGGFLGFGLVFAWAYEEADNADVQAERQRLNEHIEHLKQERDSAQEQAEQRYRQRLQETEQTRLLALRQMDEAKTLKQQAEAERRDSTVQIEQFKLRTRNAICAAERIKNRAQQSPKPQSVP